MSDIALASADAPVGSRLYWAASDSFTLIARSIRHSLRSVDALMVAVFLPVSILLLFVYVFGGAIRTGTHYIDYVVPGIILLCAGFGSASTSVSVCNDMTTGAIDRFRSLPIVSSAVLTGHVLAGVLRNVVSTLLVLGVAVLIGFRPNAGFVQWLGVLGVLLLFMGAISWLAASFGLLVRNVEAAGAFAFIVMFLPYVSSAFVPTRTMPGVLRAIASHQPITPITETLRGLMMGTPIGNNALIAVAWCTGAMAAGCAAATLLFRNRTAP
jgi:ABC-2 type transport system permease protein